MGRDYKYSKIIIFTTNLIFTEALEVWKKTALIGSQNPKIKATVSQKLFKIQISNFRFFLLSGRRTIGVKIKEIGEQSAWDILDFR